MPRTHQNFNHNWLFLLDDNASYCLPDYDDSQWKKLTLPHDWSIELPLDERSQSGSGGGYATAGTAWYRKHFSYDPDFEGKIVSLMFDGIYMDSRIYLNGVEVGSNGYGYSSFSVDLTNQLNPGDNVLAVRVDNSHQPNSRWYTGSGIYRNVWLDVTEKVHMKQWGVFCSVTKLLYDNTFATIRITADICNESDKPVNSGVIHRLYDAEGNLVLQSGTALQLEAGEQGRTMTHPGVNDVHLWSDTDPYLYTLTSTVLMEEEPVDEVSMKVGLRTATFECDKGFLLNGKSVKIKGMCVHHDCGLTGAVGYRETWERRLRRLKDMGCNGVRCAHNPPSPELLDLCDELGFLVMDEAFDEWLLTKDKNRNYYSKDFTYGSSMFFDRHAEEIMVMMLHRDRNHPSVVIWSIGNEIPEQSAGNGAGIAKWLQDICHREDCTRMVTAACDCIAAAQPSTALREFEEVLDVVGYNYVDRWRERVETQYEEDRHLFPKRCFIGTENASVGGERGLYVARDKARAYRYNYLTAPLRHEWLWRYMASRDFVAGDYLWTGVDYLGESNWPRRGSVSGPIDSAGFPKDSYYYFRSVWNKEDLTLHIVPHWNWKGQEGEYKQVVVYTNCDQVELYINDHKVGTKACGGPYYGAVRSWNERPMQVTTHDLHLTFDVVYEPGVLRAVGYKNGEIAMETVVETTGEAVSLKAAADRLVMKTDGIAHIDISTLDAEGRHVPTATPMVRCEVVSGPGRLIGMDAGDMYDLTVYPAPERRMFSGWLMAMVSAREPGQIRVKISSEGMEPVYVEIKAEG